MKADIRRMSAIIGRYKKKYFDLKDHITEFKDNAMKTCASIYLV